MRTYRRLHSFLKSLPLAVLCALLVGSAACQADPYIEFISPNEQSGGEFGWATAGVPDTNGDGVWDVVVGAPRENPGGSPSNAGRAYLFDGATGALLHPFISPHEEIDGLFGFAASGLTDVNGDGAGDILVGTESEDPGSSPSRAGRAYVFSGSSGELLHELISPNEQSAGEFGQSLSGIPDVNGDGTGDLLVGANQETTGGGPSWAGRAYIFDGSTGLPLRMFISPNQEAEGHFGGSVLGVPDINGNGSGEALIAASSEGGATIGSNPGVVYLFDGATGELLRTFVSPAPYFGGFFGSYLSWMPDIDGNDAVEFIVGAGGEEGSPGPGFRGRSYVLDSATGNLIHLLTSPNYETYDRFGWTSSVPDLDQDGFADIVAGGWDEGAIGAPRGPFFRSGNAYIFSGQTGQHLRTLDSPNRQPGGSFNYPTFGMPDTNGDGLGDFLVGSGEFSGAGRVYLFRSSSIYPQIYVNRRSVLFAPRLVGSGPSNPETVTIRNHGVTDLNFLAAEVTFYGADAGQFSIFADSGENPLGPNRSRTVDIVFHPSSAGVKSATLGIIGDVPGEPMVEVALSGTGYVPTPTPTASPTPTATPTSTPTATPTTDPSTVDSDGDGVTDFIEDDGPNAGDGNEDGIPDRNQANVVSLPNEEDGQYVTLTVADGHTLSGVEAVNADSPPTNPPEGVDHPLGLFEFTIAGVTPGGPATAELILPDEFKPNSYFKYGRSSEDANPHWYRFMFDGTTGAVIDFDHITLWFIDGERGDDDLTADGVIKDPGGPANVVSFGVENWSLY